MSFLFDNVPYFYCLVRREYTTAHKRGHGEYLSAVAHAVYCRRARMISFQVLFLGEDHAGVPAQTGGAMFARVPVQALCWKPCSLPAADDCAAWDVFGETFTVVELDLLMRGTVVLLPRRLSGRYLFSIDFCASDLADDPAQHKQLHIIKVDEGFFAAVPNNRMLYNDPAFFVTATERPDFESDCAEYYSE